MAKTIQYLIEANTSSVVFVAYFTRWELWTCSMFCHQDFLQDDTASLFVIGSHFVMKYLWYILLIKYNQSIPWPKTLESFNRICEKKTPQSIPIPLTGLSLLAKLQSLLQENATFKKETSSNRFVKGLMCVCSTYLFKRMRSSNFVSNVYLNIFK